MIESVMDKTFTWVDGGGEVHEGVPEVYVPEVGAGVHEVSRQGVRMGRC